MDTSSRGTESGTAFVTAAGVVVLSPACRIASMGSRVLIMGLQRPHISCHAKPGMGRFCKNLECR